MANTHDTKRKAPFCQIRRVGLWVRNSQLVSHVFSSSLCLQLCRIYILTSTVCYKRNPLVLFSKKECTGRDTWRHNAGDIVLSHTFPPSTSSPIIRHAAVLIVRSPVADIFKAKTVGRMRDRVVKEEDAAMGKRCLAAWDSRANMDEEMVETWDIHMYAAREPAQTTCFSLDIFRNRLN